MFQNPWALARAQELWLRNHESGIMDFEFWLKGLVNFFMGAA
jgi:hypothetical protein